MLAAFVQLAEAAVGVGNWAVNRSCPVRGQAEAVLRCLGLCCLPVQSWGHNYKATFTVTSMQVRMPYLGKLC